MFELVIYTVYLVLKFMSRLDSLSNFYRQKHCGECFNYGPPRLVRFPSTVHIETDIKPGEFVMRTLFAEFTIQA
jgi:hypothetical protein